MLKNFENIKKERLSYHKKKSFKDNFYVIAELPFQSGKQEDLKTITISSKMEIINQTYNKLELVFQSSRDNKIILSNDGEIYLLKKYWKNGNNFYIYKLGQEIISEREIKLKNKKIAALDFANATEREADGEKRASIKKAEGIKQAAILKAEGEADAIRLVNESAEKYFT